MIKIVGTVFIAIYVITGFVAYNFYNKAIELEQLACKNLIQNNNLENEQKTTKTIIKYEKVKNDIVNYDTNQRSKLLQQIEDFNFDD